MTYKYNPLTNELDYVGSTGSGTGDVSGPGSSTNLAIARFNGTTGTLLSDSTALLDNSGNLSLTGGIAADTNTLVVNSTTHRVGIGQTSPSASLHLKAGTAGANGAPLKLQAGINLATPEDGAIEYDGINLYYTDSSAVRKTLSTTGGSGTGITWQAVAGTSQAAQVNYGYICQNSGLTQISLPATAAVGSVIEVLAHGIGGFSISQGASQSISFGAYSSTVGVTGSLSSTQVNDTVRILCVTANTDWVVLSSVGTLIVQ